MKIQMIFAAIGATALLTGCSDPVADAREKLEMVEDVGTYREICDAYKGVADAYLKVRDKENYVLYHRLARSQCANGELDFRLSGRTSPH